MNPTIVVLLLVAFSGTFHSGRITRTSSNMRLLENAVQSFRDTAGRLPAREEGLSVLIHKPSDWPAEISWISFLDIDDVPCDGWGHEFVYVLDSNLPHGFGLYSRGPDGVTSSGGNDRDDLASWRDASTSHPFREILARVAELLSRPTSLAATLLIVAAVLALVRRGIRSKSRLKP